MLLLGILIVVCILSGVWLAHFFAKQSRRNETRESREIKGRQIGRNTKKN